MTVYARVDLSVLPYICQVREILLYRQESCLVFDGCFQLLYGPLPERPLVLIGWGVRSKMWVEEDGMQ